MCVVRHLRDFRRRRPHRARPARPPASRPGGLRHRHLRRPPFPQSPRGRPGRRHFRRAVGHGQAQGLFGDRPQPLCHDRRLVRPQHPADLRRLRLRRPGARPQRQPHQRLPAAQGAGADGLPVPVDHRHRGHQPPDRALELFDRGRPPDRRARPRQGRLLAAAADQRGADRRARSAGRAAAGHRAGSRTPGS